MSEPKILQPKNCKLEDIKHEITQSADKIVDIATYPSGFVLKTVTVAEEIQVSSNRPLIKIDESTYQIPE